MKTAIREFLANNFYVPKAELLTDDASLFDLGIIDSTGVLEVVSFLESRFAIRVADDELVPENLDSVSRMVAYVQRKQMVTTPALGQVDPPHAA